MSTIDAYASRTGTKRNLAALRAAGWGLFVSAAGVHRNEDFRFVIDNGAWTAYTSGVAWPVAPFEAVLEKLGRSPLCEGIVAPDIVCGGAESLRLSVSWLERLLAYETRVYIPVQPGIAPDAMAPLLGPRVGVFVGGESAWKEATCGAWARLAHEHGARCHVGRVNSLRRLMLCKAAAVDSFDGSGPSRFEVVLHEMERFRAMACQMGLRLRVVADCFWEADGEVFYLRVEVLLGETLDVILMAAQAAGAGEVFEVQTDDGIYDLRGVGFLTWEQLEAAA